MRTRGSVRRTIESSDRGSADDQSANTDPAWARIMSILSNRISNA